MNEKPTSNFPQTPEAVALYLTSLILASSGNNTSDAACGSGLARSFHGQGAVSEKIILDTYARCFKATTGQRTVESLEE